MWRENKIFQALPLCCDHSDLFVCTPWHCYMKILKIKSKIMIIFSFLFPCSTYILYLVVKLQKIKKYFKAKITPNYIADRIEKIGKGEMKFFIPLVSVSYKKTIIFLKNDQNARLHDKKVVDFPEFIW